MITNSRVISDIEINEYLREFVSKRSGSDGSFALEIVASNEVKDIDLKLFAYLLLVHETNPRIEQKIVLHKNDSVAHGRLVAQVLRFWAYAYLVTGQVVFRAWFGGNEVTRDVSVAKTKEQRTKNRKALLRNANYFTLSKNFTPLLFVTQDSKDNLYDLFFKSDIAAHVFRRISALNRVTLNREPSYAITRARTTIIRRSSDTSRGSRLKDLATLAFLQCLDEAKILIAFVFDKQTMPSEDELKSSGLRMGNLTVKNHLDYYRAVTPIFSELVRKPPAYLFFFSALLASELTKEETSKKHILTTENKFEFVEQLFHLWGFTKDLMYGVNELARNAVEHSSTRQGAIFARVFKRKGNIPKVANPQFEAGLFERRAKCFDNKDFSSLIEVSVLDIGDRSIVETLLTNTKKMRERLSKEGENDELLGLLQEDINSLSATTYGLKSILDPSSGEVLNQQAKRSIAHFGLLTLSKLINKNGGQLSVHSGQADSDVSCRIGHIDRSIAFEQEHVLGTSFSIQLPISPSKPYQSDPVNRISVPMEISETELSGLEELFNFEYVSNVDRVGDSILKGLVPVALVRPDKSSQRGRAGEHEVWRQIESKVDDILERTDNDLRSADGKSDVLLHLDLASVDFEGSQLFRLLGNLGIHFGHIPLLVTSISTDRYFQLLDTNALFLSINESVAYWTDNQVTLAYPYIELEAGDKFFYTDVIWGRTRSDFIAVNKLVSRTHFNALHTSGWGKQDRHNTQEPHTNMNFSRVFINQNVLLPFDLMLKSGDLSIFEHNALVLLQNEL